jgi:hypothetical protein
MLWRGLRPKGRSLSEPTLGIGAKSRRRTDREGINIPQTYLGNYNCISGGSSVPVLCSQRSPWIQACAGMTSEHRIHRLSGGDLRLRSSYPDSANAASTAFRFAPTSNFPPRFTSGRRTSRGSWSINSTILSSESSWSDKPMFFKLGLRRANIWEMPTSWAKSLISCSLKGTLKKSRSSNVTPFCKSNSLTLQQEDQRGHQ